MRLHVLVHGLIPYAPPGNLRIDDERVVEKEGLQIYIAKK